VDKSVIVIVITTRPIKKAKRGFMRYFHIINSG